MYQTHLALCRRTRKFPVITKQVVVGIYLRYLHEDLGARGAREDRRTTHSLLRDARGFSVVSGEVTVLLTVTGVASRLRWSGVATQPSQTGSYGRPPYPQLWKSTDPAHRSMRKARDRQFLTVDDRDFPIGMHGRRCPPHASHRDRMSPGPGTVLKMSRDGTRGTRCPEAAQLIGATPRTRARCDGRRST